MGRVGGLLFRSVLSPHYTKIYFVLCLFFYILLIKLYRNILDGTSRASSPPTKKQSRGWIFFLGLVDLVGTH